MGDFDDLIPKGGGGDFDDLIPKKPKPAPKPKRTNAQEAVRSLGLGARGLIEGAAGLVGVVANPFITGANQFLGANQATMEQAGTALSDNLGLPAPQTPTERVSSDITRSLVGGVAPVAVGRQMAAKVPGVVSNVGRALSSMAGRQVASAATGAGAAGATREAGGGQGAQATAGLLGALAPGGGLAVGEAGIRAVTRGGEGGRQAMERTIADFARVGATPSIGQATQGRVARGIESLLAGAPTSKNRMGEFAERQAESIGEGLGRVASGMSRNPSAEGAGRAIRDGVEAFSGNVAATKQALYWQADRFVPPTSGTPMANTVRVLSGLTTPNPGAAATTGRLVNPKMRQMLDDLQTDLQANNGQIPYESLRRIRTQIGEQMNDYSMTQDTPAKQLSALYGALSRDMEEVARAIGPAAESAAKRANTFTRVAAKRMEAIQSVVDKNGGTEKVYTAAMSGTRDGGTTLRSVLQSLDKDGQKAVAGAVVKRMGLANASQRGMDSEAFSAQTFLTNWNNVSPEAKRALFSRLGPKYSADIDRIARVADNIRAGSKVYANPAGTADRGLAYTYYGGVLPSTAILGATTGNVAPFVGAVLGGVSANVLARAMTNPKIVSWLARNTEAPVSTLPQAVMTLRNVSANDPDVQELVAELSQPSQQAENE